MKIEQYKKKSVCVYFDDHFKDHQFCEVTEWYNGEGFDIAINEDKYISLTHSQLDAFLAATSAINLRDPKND
jgi:hypothetical protein